MKGKKTIYLYACPSALDKNIVHTNLMYKYVIVGNCSDALNLNSLTPSSIDYLIVFANKRKLDTLVKRQLNFLHHIFNHIVVVGEKYINVLDDYIYIPSKLINNKLYWIIKIIENGLDRPLKYSYKSFCLSADDLLSKWGFNVSYKGYKYIIDSAYNVAITNGKTSLKLIYNLLAQIYQSSTNAIERCVRFSIESARKISSSTTQLDWSNISNKKFIVLLNQCIAQDLMK